MIHLLLSFARNGQIGAAIFQTIAKFVRGLRKCFETAYIDRFHGSVMLVEHYARGMEVLGNVSGLTLKNMDGRTRCGIPSQRWNSDLEKSTEDSVGGLMAFMASPLSWQQRSKTRHPSAQVDANDRGQR